MINKLWARFLIWLFAPAWQQTRARFEIRIGEIGDRIDELNYKMRRQHQAQQVAMSGIRAAADGGRYGRNWVLLSFRRGDREIVHVFDFGNNNMGALIDMLRGFERAGICVTADLPPGVKVNP